MPKVGSRHSKFGLKKNKKKLHLVLKKKQKKLLYSDSWVPFLRQEESVFMNAGLRGRGWGGTQTFLWYACACHFEKQFDPTGTEELSTNVHEPMRRQR